MRARGVGRGLSGLTLIEVVLGTLALSVALAALLGAYLGQVTLNEHARNLSLAAHDANRVVEQLRLNNVGCAGAPSAAAAGGWNAWLNGQVPGKSIQNPNQNAEEFVVVTCQNRGADAYCGNAAPAQVAAQEWASQGAATTFDPLRVTVAVCWRHRNRTIGECAWNGAALTANDAGGDNDGVVESPAMVTTLVTCRG
jgi:Tfp pilus assembly protein PilV